ncbi:hypothetical protein COCOBI_01-8560 [Coccomyxa sp. Obi]|nr:hypothetical protein COCOBI_01-8560 [Coccomyxa sp. Obi]
MRVGGGLCVLGTIGWRDSLLFTRHIYRATKCKRFDGSIKLREQHAYRCWVYVHQHQHEHSYALLRRVTE